MIAFAGMGDKLPNICFYNSQEKFHKPYSEKTAELIDNEVKALIAEQYERAKRMLMEYKEGHRELADLLMEREVIFAEDAERIFGKRAWASRSEEIMEAEPAKPEPKKRKATEKVVAETVTEVVAEISEKVVEVAPAETPEAAAPEVPVAETPAKEAPAAPEAPATEAPTLSEAPKLTETPELTEPAVAPKRPRKRKTDDNLFGGFDFDQEDNK